MTAGTNIMEELAYFADLTVRSPKPVVFTGSMRQSNTFSFDGEANLFNAIRLAASQETTCYGTVLMMNDEFSPPVKSRKRTPSVWIHSMEDVTEHWVPLMRAAFAPLEHQQE